MVEELKKEYRLIHADNEVNRMVGEQIMYWVWDIQDLTFEFSDNKILDFGCGKCYAYKNRHIHRVWNAEKVIFYDIGIPEYEKKPPVGEFNCVVSCDVLEHIPENELDSVFEYWYSSSNMNFVFATIAGYPAQATLSNGSNAHVTLKPVDWWIEKIKKYQNCKTEIVYFPEKGKQYNAEKHILEV